MAINVRKNWTVGLAVCMNFQQFGTIFQLVRTANWLAQNRAIHLFIRWLLEHWTLVHFRLRLPSDADTDNRYHIVWTNFVVVALAARIDSIFASNWICPIASIAFMRAHILCTWELENESAWIFLENDESYLTSLRYDNLHSTVQRDKSTPVTAFTPLQHIRTSRTHTHTHNHSFDPFQRRLQSPRRNRIPSAHWDLYRSRFFLGSILFLSLFSLLLRLFWILFFFYSIFWIYPTSKTLQQ